MIIGSGSASFEILRYLVERLPVMVTPRWVSTPAQPIAIRDALFYLVECLRTPETTGRTLDIGGPDVVTYREIIDLLAEVRGLNRRRILPVPVLTPRLSSLWIHLVTPREPAPRATARGRPAQSRRLPQRRRGRADAASTPHDPRGGGGGARSRGAATTSRPRGRTRARCPAIRSGPAAPLHGPARDARRGAGRGRLRDGVPPGRRARLVLRELAVARARRDGPRRGRARSDPRPEAPGSDLVRRRAGLLARRRARVAAAPAPAGGDEAPRRRPPGVRRDAGRRRGLPPRADGTLRAARTGRPPVLVVRGAVPRTGLPQHARGASVARPRRARRAA